MSASTDNHYCDNTIKKNNKEYKLEKIWRSKKTDYLRDSKGELFPFPKHNSKKWTGEQIILNRLTSIEEYLDSHKIYHVYPEPKDCLLCDKKHVTTKRYEYMNMMWEDGLEHYILVHNIEPS